VAAPSFKRRWVVLACAALAACGSPESSGPTLEGPRLAVDEALRIGSVDDESTSLTWFRSMAVGPDGRIYTGHLQDNRVAVHDASGRPMGDVSRSGQGPGEFGRVGTVGMVGDTLWVLDQGEVRFELFDGGGNFIGSRKIEIRLGKSFAEYGPQPTQLMRDGSVVGLYPVPSSAVADGSRTQMTYVHMSDAGEALDTIATWDISNTTLEITDPDNPRRFASYSAQPFADADIVTLSQTEPLVAIVERRVAEESPRVTVTLRRDTGDTLWTRVFGYEPIPIETSEVDSIVDAIGKLFDDPRRGTVMPAAKAAAVARERMYIPSHHPAVSMAVLGTDGTVWLKRESKRGQGGAVWTVLDRGGDVAGTVVLPVRLTVYIANATGVWGMDMDDLDVPYIVHYTIEQGVVSDTEKH
jgi:hypothetical protein